MAGTEDKSDVMVPDCVGDSNDTRDTFVDCVTGGGRGQLTV